MDRLKTVSDLLRTVGLWALGALVAWFGSEVRNLRMAVQQLSVSMASITERVVGVDARLKRVEDRLDRMEKP